MKKTCHLVILGIGGLVILTSCFHKLEYEPEGKSVLSVLGENFELVAKYEPLRIFVYADTSSTNKIPDYVVFQGTPALPVIFRETSQSNTVVVTHFENGLGIVSTIYDAQGIILKRTVDEYDNNSARLKCSYVSTNGDGYLDYFIRYGKHTDVFIRSNLCWVPYVKIDNGKSK